MWCGWSLYFEVALGKQSKARKWWMTTGITKLRNDNTVLPSLPRIPSFRRIFIISHTQALSAGHTNPRFYVSPGQPAHWMEVRLANMSGPRQRNRQMLFFVAQLKFWDMLSRDLPKGTLTQQTHFCKVLNSYNSHNSDMNRVMSYHASRPLLHMHGLDMSRLLTLAISLSQHSSMLEVAASDSLKSAAQSGLTEHIDVKYQKRSWKTRKRANMIQQDPTGTCIL